MTWLITWKSHLGLNLVRHSNESRLGAELDTALGVRLGIQFVCHDDHNLILILTSPFQTTTAATTKIQQWDMQRNTTHQYLNFVKDIDVRVIFL
jgi:hypothetical protein